MTATFNNFKLKLQFQKQSIFEAYLEFREAYMHMSREFKLLVKGTHLYLYINV